MIPRETVQQIQDAAKIEEVISDFVTLKRRGSGFVACCPFHNEKTPSFHVSPAKGIYKCFGCGKSGSAVGFVMEYEHCSYSDALKYIARKYHIEVREEELSAEEIISRQKHESLLIVSEFAQKFFVSQLSTPEGRAVAMSYYHKRRLEDSTIASEGLGWAPSGRRTFTDAALAAGLKEEYLVETGLTIRHDDGTLTDRFRERVMFPLHSLSGRVLAFSGRALDKDNPAKYVNSPESEIYTKSKALLGIYFAKTEISRLDKCYLVEGNIDVITLHQLGIKNVVASCGTSLTSEQIRLIRKFTNNITIMYDGDGAGIKAALRGTDMVLEEDMNVRIVLLPEGEDPDSFGGKHTLEEFQAYIAENEEDFISFKSGRLMAEAGRDPLRRAEKINEIADTIAKISDPVKRSVCVQECARKFDLDSGILFERIARTRRETMERQSAPKYARDNNPVQPSSQNSSSQESPGSVLFENKLLAPLEEEVLMYLLRFGNELLEFGVDSPFYEEQPRSVADFILSSLADDQPQMLNSLYQKIYSRYEALFRQGMGPDQIVQSFMEDEDQQLAAVVGDIVMEKYEITCLRFQASMTVLPTWLVMNVPHCLVLLACRKLEVQILELKKAIKAAPGIEEQRKLLAELTDLQKIKKQIEDNNK